MSQNEPRYPDITVHLSTGTDGNTTVVLAKITGALRGAGAGDQVAGFMAEALAGDYNHMLKTCMEWVNVT